MLNGQMSDEEREKALVHIDEGDRMLRKSRRKVVTGLAVLLALMFPNAGWTIYLLRIGDFTLLDVAFPAIVVGLAYHFMKGVEILGNIKETRAIGRRMRQSIEEGE